MKCCNILEKYEQNWFSKITQSAWLVPFLYNHFWIAAAFSLIQPFFPMLAASRYIEAWKYGFVFSTYKLAMLIGTSGAQKAMSMTSHFAVYMAGQWGYFIFCILQGSLYWFANGSELLWVSLLAACIGGCADSVSSVVTFAIITTHFKKRSGVVIACMEFLRQVGNMLGAFIGGIMIDFWAYPLPHYTFGGLLVLSTPFMLKLQTRLSEKSDVETRKLKTIPENSNPNYWVLLKTPLFIIDMVSIMMSWMTIGFNDTTLEPSLEKFRLSSTKLGDIFTAQYGSCAVGAIISGVFCHYEAETFYALVGQVLAAFAYVMWGPAPFLKCESSLWMVYLSQVFTGLSSAAMFTCAYSHALKVVGFRGFPESIRTKGFVSSSVFTFLVIGGTITPPFAGKLVEILGFRMATMAFCGLLVAWVPVTFAVWIRSSCSMARIRTSHITPPTQ